MTSPAWQDALPTPPFGARLIEAWMTSFERPDAGFLVEHLLPSLLGASHSLSQDLQERALFFGKLGTTLETLRGRLTLISSPPKADREPHQYRWLWRYLNHFIVGSIGKSVQHAKLWAFHWETKDTEFIELRISSANLTLSAFKEQIQAGWHAVLPLEKSGSVRKQKSWGELVPFLNALGSSAGQIAAGRIARLSTVLGRVECPPDVTIIASIPGAKSAARQLKQFGSSEIHILTPTIGEWDRRILAAWGDDVGISAQGIHLKWIPDGHSWSISKGWSLSKNTATSLAKDGVKLRCIPAITGLTEQGEDLRWSHAKLYLLRFRRKRHLLVTSANWSPSAWGAGRLSPKNFEIGVVFETKWDVIESFNDKFDPPRTTPFVIDQVDPDDAAGSLYWAEASWNGEELILFAGSSDVSSPIIATVSFSNESRRIVSLSDGAGTEHWVSSDTTPTTAAFSQGDDSIEIDVIDLRSPSSFAKTPLPEIDPLISKALREAFLLQRYGGPVVDLISLDGLKGNSRQPVLGGCASDYSVQAWLESRSAFKVVDRWRKALEDGQDEPETYERIISDGLELKALYAGRGGAAAELATEEIEWRLAARV